MVESGAGAERDAERAASHVIAAGHAAAEAGDTTKNRAGDSLVGVKPRFRGVSHRWAFFASLVLGAGLVAAARTDRAKVAVAIYAASLWALFGVSALYHGVGWRRPEVSRVVRRLDHVMIFFLIAGTSTPFCLLVLHGDFATALLGAIWLGAATGAVVDANLTDAPRWMTAVVYLSVGWVGAAAVPAIVVAVGITAGALIALGGGLYTAGAVVYARQRPDPNPAVFGYHEIFHLLVIAAAASHFAAVAVCALAAAGT